MIFRVLILFLISSQVLAQPQPQRQGKADQANKLDKIKRVYDENTQKQIPNLLNEEMRMQWRVATPMCDRQKLPAQIIQCSYLKCLQKLEMLPGAVYSEIIIHGQNSAGLCVVSALQRSYFVPKKDLVPFSKAYTRILNVDSFSVNSTATTEGSTAIEKVEIDGKICQVKLDYVNELDPTNTEIVTFTPSKEDGIAFSEVNGKRETIYTTHGKSYRVKSGEIKLIPKLTRISHVEPIDPKCKDPSVTVLFDLQKAGLVREI